MYKHKNKTRLEKSRRPLLWIKRKLILIITAFMLGMSNGMNMEDRTIKGNHFQTEQQDKKD
ncbi:hypothetical protein [Flavobacterium sp.]|uniref:hypothetical protein n=1 Tax=Flavobacterium sp. TaxID=239 RepID=UPI0032676671